MRDVTLVILNSLRIKCHIRRPLSTFKVLLPGSDGRANGQSFVQTRCYWSGLLSFAPKSS